jgi:hypothetical protein
MPGGKTIAPQPSGSAANAGGPDTMAIKTKHTNDRRFQNLMPDHPRNILPRQAKNHPVPVKN